MDYVAFYGGARTGSYTGTIDVEQGNSLYIYAGESMGNGGPGDYNRAIISSLTRTRHSGPHPSGRMATRLRSGRIDRDQKKVQELGLFFDIEGKVRNASAFLIIYGIVICYTSS